MKKFLTLSLILLTGTAMTSFATDAEAIWTNQCKKCHGADGSGDTKMGKKLHIKDYTNAELQAEFTDEEAFTIIKEGKKSDKGKTRMKPAKEVTDEEINALVQYVRGLQKCG